MCYPTQLDKTLFGRMLMCFQARHCGNQVLIFIVYAAWFIGLCGCSTVPNDNSANCVVQGRVRYIGQPLPQLWIPLPQGAPCPLPRILDESVVLSEDGGVANAVVMLSPIRHAQRTGCNRTVGLEIRECKWQLRVNVLAAGGVVLLKNADVVMHNVDFKAPRNQSFNTNLAPGIKILSEPLGSRDIVSIRCLLHPWEKAWVVVHSNEWYALSDEHGQFVIRDIAPGGYYLRVWHERLRPLVQEQVVAVAERATVDLDCFLKQ